MNCVDYQINLGEWEKLLKELDEIRCAITGLGLEFDHGMSEAYRQGFQDGFETAKKET